MCKLKTKVKQKILFLFLFSTQTKLVGMKRSFKSSVKIPKFQQSRRTVQFGFTRKKTMKTNSITSSVTITKVLLQFKIPNRKRSERQKRIFRLNNAIFSIASQVHVHIVG